MTKTYGHILSACVCAVALTSSSTAWADSWSTGTSLVWPSASGDTPATDVPRDTSIWLRSDSYDVAGYGYRLLDAAGDEVELDIERVDVTPSVEAPDIQWVVLRPSGPLAPDASYTVSVSVSEGDGVVSDVSFETGATLLGSSGIEASEVEYLAIEGLDLDLSSCCVLAFADTQHAVRWRSDPSSTPWFARLTVTHPGEDPVTSVSFGGDPRPDGQTLHTARTSSHEEDSYPCVDFAIEDITGAEIATLSTCEPAACVDGSGPSEPGTSVPNVASWDDLESDCALYDVPGPAVQDGCAAAPTSPIPRAPIALGGLALLGLLTRRRSEQ